MDWLSNHIVQIDYRSKKAKLHSVGKVNVYFDDRLDEEVPNKNADNRLLR